MKASTLFLLFLLPLISFANYDKVDLLPHCDSLSYEESLKKIIALDIYPKNRRKWLKNSIGILKSKNNNILPKFKKKFKARIVVQRVNGITCFVNGKIRQNGDFKDHIQFSDSNFIQSLDVKLDSGHIENYVSFKLLIPQTRNADNEMILTTLLKNLNYIVPKTRYINVSFSGMTKIKMLIQEKARKELLEALNFREAPIIEGNETLFWSNKNGDKVLDGTYVFAKLENNAWAKKNRIAYQIANNSLTELNSQFYDALISNHFDNAQLSNGQKSHEEYLNIYEALLASSAANHGLAPHNRKFYFDPIKSQYHPIYFDGNATFEVLPEDFTEGKWIPSIKQVSREALNRIRALDLADIYRQIKEKGANVNSEQFYKKIENLRINLENFISNTEFIDENMDKQLGLKEYFIASRETSDKVFFIAFDNSPEDQNSYSICSQLFKCRELTLDKKSQSVLLEGKFLYENLPVLYLGKIDQLGNNFYFQKNPIKKLQQKKITSDLFKIMTSRGISIDIKNNDIFIKQLKPYARAVLFDSVLKNRNIFFEGYKNQNNFEDIYGSRFDENLLTGCLTFMDVKFDDVNIKSQSAACEDSVNIIRSTGFIDSININDSSSDALDIDFSELHINEAFITNAGNDCVDISAGKVTINDLLGQGCNDKALSVGEKSQTTLNLLKVKESNIGVASKDSSVVKINHSALQDVNLCAIANKKKQEFDGSLLVFENLICKSKFKDIEQDNSSTINILNRL